METNLESGFDLIGKGFAPNALTALSGAGRVSCLDHEASYVAVKFDAVVYACGAESEEVFSRLWSCLAKNLDLCD